MPWPIPQGPWSGLIQTEHHTLCSGPPPPKGTTCDLLHLLRFLPSGSLAQPQLLPWSPPGPSLQPLTSSLHRQCLRARSNLGETQTHHKFFFHYFLLARRERTASRNERFSPMPSLSRGPNSFFMAPRSDKSRCFLSCKRALCSKSKLMCMVPLGAARALI